MTDHIAISLQDIHLVQSFVSVSFSSEIEVLEISLYY